MAYGCKILADSINNICDRLTTFEITFPRIVLAELNTHRALSRNSASSRAIPVEKRIAAVLEDPFVPEAFGRNQKGMQATSDLSGTDDERARELWLSAMRDAVRSARALAETGVHKQLANRLLEPFCWQTAIVSATEWKNFFALRCNPDAQPEIRTIAEMMRAAMADSTPTLRISADDWHLPLTPDIDRLAEFESSEVPFVSAGRCARVSYLTHDGNREPRADLNLARRLREAGHMSPFEHVARPAYGEEETGNFVGWRQLRKTLPGEAVFAGVPSV